VWIDHDGNDTLTKLEFLRGMQRLGVETDLEELPSSIVAGASPAPREDTSRFFLDQGSVRKNLDPPRI
jgi:hypothetical protein